LNPKLNLKASLERKMSQGLPNTIKAIVAPEPGGVDKIQQVELPFPEQKPNEIVVKVRVY
jgi:hypothetical protein